MIMRETQLWAFNECLPWVTHYTRNFLLITLFNFLKNIMRVNFKTVDWTHTFIATFSQKIIKMTKSDTFILLW